MDERAAARERRYLLIAQDGRHTTLGRHTEPDEETLDTAAEGLDSHGLAPDTASDGDRGRLAGSRGRVPATTRRGGSEPSDR